MVLDATNAFIQTNVPPKKCTEEIVIIKIIGVLVEILVEIYSETYRNHVVFSWRESHLSCCVEINSWNSCSRDIIL